MTNSVLLNSVDHHDLRVALGHSAAFGDAVNQALILPTEFEAAQRDYPIIFRRDGQGGYQAFALLGLDRDENLFLGADGWEDGRYVPALMQRGPFSIGVPGGEGDGGGREPMLYVDLDHPRIAADGAPVFLPQGGHSPYLDHVLKMLRAIHEGAAVNAPMFAAFEAEGLLEEVTFEVSLDDGRSYSLPDCLTVSPAALAGLDGAALGRLHRGGNLHAATMAVSSLGTMPRLIELKTRRRLAEEGRR